MAHGEFAGINLCKPIRGHPSKPKKVNLGNIKIDSGLNYTLQEALEELDNAQTNSRRCDNSRKVLTQHKF